MCELNCDRTIKTLSLGGLHARELSAVLAEDAGPKLDRGVLALTTFRAAVRAPELLKEIAHQRPSQATAALAVITASRTFLIAAV